MVNNKDTPVNFLRMRLRYNLSNLVPEVAEAFQFSTTPPVC